MKLLGRNIFFLGTALALTASFSACSKTSEDAESGKDALTGTSCQIVNVKAGRAMTTEELGKLNDPIAEFVLAGKDCPTGFAEVTAKLKKTDAVGCSGGGGSSGSSSGAPPIPSAQPSGSDTAGISTRFVSERSQVEGKGDSFRAVVARQCNGRKDHELLISLFGIGADGSLPNDLEAIGQDKTSGVFNYYAREDNTWKFFGNSLDLIGDGYDCNANGACTPKAASKTRCAGCHVGGGLIMKEKDSPWVHWEGERGTKTPGVEKLFAASPGLLGSRGDGIDMESKVTKGNTSYIPKRIEFLKTKGVAELLRPLFCTVDINLQSSSGDGVPRSIRNEVFLDRVWQNFDTPSINPADYTALVAQFRQRIEGSNGQLKDQAGKPVDDTFFKFTFPERGALDDIHVNELLTSNIVDSDFIRDVLHVDFTRPIFSAARCSLIKFAPTLTADKMTPDAIREGFKKALAADGSAAGRQLLANLNAVGDAAAHKADVTAFMTACQARDKKAFLTDVFAFLAHQRKAARANVANSRQGIIEFSETMVVDDIADTNKALDPVDCTLK